MANFSGPFQRGRKATHAQTTTTRSVAGRCLRFTTRPCRNATWSTARCRMDTGPNAFQARHTTYIPRCVVSSTVGIPIRSVCPTCARACGRTLFITFETYVITVVNGRATDYAVHGKRARRCNVQGVRRDVYGSVWPRRFSRRRSSENRRFRFSPFDGTPCIRAESNATTGQCTFIYTVRPRASINHWRSIHYRRRRRIVIVVHCRPLSCGYLSSGYRGGANLSNDGFHDISLASGNTIWSAYECAPVAYARNTTHRPGATVRPVAHSLTVSVPAGRRVYPYSVPLLRAPERNTLNGQYIIRSQYIPRVRLFPCYRVTNTIHYKSFLSTVRNALVITSS